MAEKRNPVDIHVGGRLRLRRTLLGMSQEKLGEAVGLTFQQIQKYEKGANRIGASRMYQFSRILEVPPSFFFDGMDEVLNSRLGTDIMAGMPAAEALAKRETLELVRAYYRISEPSVRRRLFELVKAVAAPGPEEGAG